MTFFILVVWVCSDMRPYFLKDHLVAECIVSAFQGFESCSCIGIDNVGDGLLFDPLKGSCYLSEMEKAVFQIEIEETLLL